MQTQKNPKKAAEKKGEQIDGSGQAGKQAAPVAAEQ